MLASDADRLLADTEAIQAGFLALSPDMYFITRPGSRFLWVNAAFETTLGYAQHELLALRYLDLTHPQDRESAASALQGLPTACDMIAWKSRCRCKDGSYRQVSWRATLHGETDLIFASGRDVTAYQRTEEEQRMNQRLLETVIDTMPDLLCVKDREGHYLITNREWRRHYGCSPEESGRVHTLEVEARPEAERRHAWALDQQALSGDKAPVAAVFHRTLADGQARLYRSYRTALRDDEGRIVGLVGIAEDVTERNQAKQDLEESERRYRSLIEGSIEGIVILRNRKVYFANESYAAMLGYEGADEIVQLASIDVLIAPHERARMADYEAARLRGEDAPTQY